MAGFVSPEMQAKMSATNGGGRGGYTAPGVGGAGSSPGAPPQFNPAALMQYMGGQQVPSQATSFAGPARYGQPTGWNQQPQAQQLPMAASSGNPFQLPGSGTIPGYGAATSSAGPAMYGQPTEWNQQQRPAASGPLGGSATYQNPRGMAAMMQQQRNQESQANQTAYNQRMQGVNIPPPNVTPPPVMRTPPAARPQQGGGTPWQPPINPNGVYSPSNMQQNMEQMRAAMAFRNSGQAMPQGNYVNGNPGMGLYGFSGY